MNNSFSILKRNLLFHVFKQLLNTFLTVKPSTQCFWYAILFTQLVHHSVTLVTNCMHYNYTVLKTVTNKIT